MDRGSSYPISKPAAGKENRLTMRLVSPFVTAVIVLILGLIGLLLTSLSHH